LRPATTPGPSLRDFEAYYAAGATWHAEGDPYAREIWRVERRVPGVVATRDELLPFVGPPYSLPAWALFAALPYGQAAFAWGIVLACAAALLGLCIARLTDIREGSGFVALVLAGAAFGPLTSALALGQVALLSCAGIVATTLALAVRTRLVVPVATAVLAAFQPNLGCVLVARLGDRRAWFALAMAAALVAATAPAVLGGLAGISRYAGVLAAHATAERTIAIAMTITAVAFGFGASDAAARAAGIAVALTVIVATALAFASRAYARAARVAVASAALPLVLPFSHEHDLAIVLFPAVWCVRRARGAWWALAACGAMLVAVDWLGLAQRPTGAAQSVALALAAALALVALSTHAPDRTAAWPFAVVAGVVVAATVAWHHPLGVWPYALGSAFQAPPGADAAAVWSLEQARSGLATPNVVAAGLRSLSLIGCAGVWLAALRALRETPPAGEPRQPTYRRS
jgi:hypothetical protein